jgi:hypothetical protein
MINGYLSEKVIIAPFSVEKISAGSKSDYHLATVASSVKSLRGSGLSELGIS